MPVDVFLVATMTTTVLLSPVAAVGVTVTVELPTVAPMPVPGALPEVTGLIAAAGAAHTSKSSRTRPSRPPSPNLTVIACECLAIMPSERAMGMPEAAFQEWRQLPGA